MVSEGRLVLLVAVRWTGRSLGGDLWVMSEHAAVLHRPTRLAGVPGDQPGGDDPVSVPPCSPAAWR